MRASFQRYLVCLRNHIELLFYILSRLAQDQLVYVRDTALATSTTVEVDEKDLADRAKQIDRCTFSLNAVYE